MGGYKTEREWKSENRRNFNFPSLCLVGGVKNFFICWQEKCKNRKYSLYKFTHMSILKNDV